MSDTVEGIFRPNGSLESVLRRALLADGNGILETIFTMSKVRRLSDKGRQSFENELGAMVASDVSAGKLTLAAGVNLQGGRVVGTWQEMWQWFLDNLPAIISALMAIIALLG